MRTDEDLLATGEPEAFGEFFRRHASAVSGFFAVRVRDGESAADLVAETFTAALLSAGRFEAQAAGSARAWLFGIARHKLADARRKERRSERALALVDVGGSVLEDDIAARADAERHGARLLSALATLPAEQREAVEARVIDERDYAEIAADLDCSEAVVRQRVSRGLRLLRTRLGGGAFLALALAVATAALLQSPQHPAALSPVHSSVGPAFRSVPTTVVMKAPRRVTASHTPGARCTASPTPARNILVAPPPGGLDYCMLPIRTR